MHTTGCAKHLIGFVKIDKSFGAYIPNGDFVQVTHAGRGPWRQIYLEYCTPGAEFQL